MRFFRCLLGFLLGLVATAAVLYRLVRPEESSFDEAFSASRHCNVLFVGPSYTKVGLDTEVFEAETRALGHPLRACKFTRNGLRSYELKHDLARLMAHRWPELERVAVDVTLRPGSIGFERENWFDPRMVHWHTWDTLSWLRGYYRARKKTLRALAPLVVAHLQHVAMNYLGVGRAGVALTRARWVERHAGWEQERVGPEDVNRLPRADKKGDRSDEEKAAAARQLAQDKARARAHRDHEDDAWPRELEPIIRQRGFEPVFYYSPVYRNRMPPRLVRPGKKPLVVLDFDDPDRYPTLYLDDSRARTSHLSRTGAQRYSRILAQEFVKLAPEPQRRREERGKRRQRRDRPDAR